MFAFPGRRVEENAIITKVRFDDETGEDMYDLVHKYVPELAYKWIPRLQIKFVPKEGDALMLAKLEVKWKMQLRRKREADERKAKREKELAMAAEAHRLEEMKTMAYRMGRREESAVSLNTRLMRGMLWRTRLFHDVNGTPPQGSVSDDGCSMPILTERPMVFCLDPQAG